MTLLLSLLLEQRIIRGLENKKTMTIPMPLSPAIENWLLQQGNLPPFTCTQVAGGSICTSLQVTTADGYDYFIKSGNQGQPTLFQAEAAGLKALAEGNSLRTPAVYHWDQHFLVLEYLQPAPAAPDYWESLANGLALLHQQTKPQFGFTIDNFCGATAQPNPLTTDGHEFFARSRLRHQATLASRRNLLDRDSVAMLESICQRLPELVPRQPPCLVHGDLWCGNIHTGPQGEPVLIDPACYWGWAETDIAMTKLFGGVPDRFYQAYTAHHALLPGWQERLALYNLYHLLNHLNLFGRSYYPEVRATLKKYG